MKTIKYQKSNRIQKILFLLFAVCFLLHPMQVHAENLLIQMSQDTIQAGDTFTVTVMVPAAASTKIYLNYTPEVFKYVSSAGEVDENSGVVSAQINAAGESYTAFSVQFQAVSAGNGSFVASAEDRENLGGASVRIDVGAAPVDMEVPEPEPDIQPADNGQDSETQESQKEEAAENQYYEIDGKKLYPSMMIPAKLVPEGFIEGKITLWDESYPYLYREGGSKRICLLYLVDENHENGELYIVDKKSPYEVYPFVCVDSRTYGALNEKTQAPAEDHIAKDEDVEKLKSQNRMILCAFIVVVLILLIIIVILLIRKEGLEEENMPPEKPKKKTQQERKPEPTQKREPERKTESRQKREPERKTESRQRREPERKTESKQKREPERENRPKPKRDPEPKTEKKHETKPQKAQKRSAFWDAMFAGIDDDLSAESFDEEIPEEKTVKKETSQKEIQKKPKKPDAGSGADEDIEFIDL